MIPKGTALIIGGSEDRGEKSPDVKGSNGFKDYEIPEKLIPFTRGSKKTIEVITTASAVPGEMEKIYKSAFKKMGFTDVGIMKIESKEDAREEKYCKRVEKAHAVLFTGGDQFTLASILGGSPCIAIIKDKYNHDKNFIVAGTSAGAMVMPGIMIYSGEAREGLLKKDLKLTSGLKLFDTCIIDTHFMSRGRFSRLVNAILVNADLLGIGLGEDTALRIVGYDAEVFGSGSVVLVDALNIGQTNIAEVDDNTPIFVENLKVHLLTGGCRFSLKDRVLFKPAKSPRKKDN